MREYPCLTESPLIRQGMRAGICRPVMRGVLTKEGNIQMERGNKKSKGDLFLPLPGLPAEEAPNVGQMKIRRWTIKWGWGFKSRGKGD